MSSKNVDNYIENAPKNQQQILLNLRKLIHEAVPNVAEDIKWSQPVFSTVHNFAYLKSNREHVNLGFFNFSRLNDPNNLLEGSGKRMRHVKIRSVNDIKTDLFKTWLKTAATK